MTIFWLQKKIMPKSIYIQNILIANIFVIIKQIDTSISTYAESSNNTMKSPLFGTFTYFVGLQYFFQEFRHSATLWTWHGRCGKFCCFFKCSLNFIAHALQSELNKVSISNFVKFRLQIMSSKIERAFEKNNKICFCLHFTNSNLNVIFFPFFSR